MPKTRQAKVTDARAAAATVLGARGFQVRNFGGSGDAELAGLLMLLDHQAEASGVRRLRAWALEALAPRPGEVAVDVGSGTGSEVMVLGEQVGLSGRAVGVEPHPGLREEAARRAELTGVRAEFVDGFADSLPFDDGSVDALRCERVFQHLDDPQAAAHEFARALAPGGRCVVIDSDWGSVIMSPGEPEVVRRYGNALRARIPNPLAGRALRNQLRAAGLVVDPDVASTALVWSDDVIADGRILRANAEAGVADGTLGRAEADRLVEEITSAARNGEAFMSVTMFGVLARKPV